MKKPDREKLSVPKLSGEMKALNGRSSRKLAECIDKLNAVLDEQRQECQCEDLDQDDSHDHPDEPR